MKEFIYLVFSNLVYFKMKIYLKNIYTNKKVFDQNQILFAYINEN